MNILLARNIFSKNWFIDPAYVESMVPVILGILSDNAEIPLDKIVESKIYSIDAGNIAGPTVSVRSSSSFENAPEGSIAVIDIQGALMKNDQFCGPVGMSTIGAWIKQADASPNIDGIILKMDTPGGTVDGTEELGKIIKGTKKPVVTFITGVLASAGYWLGSNADTIIANGETSWIGSIGVVRAFADMQPALEKAGIKIHEIYSSLSPDKNKDYNESRAGDYDSTRTNILDPLAKMFHETVKANRGDKLSSKEDTLTGKMYFAKDAKKYGLIDSIGTMDDAISFIRNNKKKSNNMADKKNRANLNKALGWKEGAEATAEGTYLQESELDTLEEKLTTLESVQAENVRLTTENGTVDTLKDAASKDATIIDALNLKVKTLEAKVTELSAKPNSRGTHTTIPKDDAPEGGKKSPYVDDGSRALLERNGLA